MSGARRSLGPVALALALLLSAAAARAGLDRTHAAWTELLREHVVLRARGTASRADYAGFARERAKLRAYLAQLSAVTPAEFTALPRADQIALLVNAYNAATIELILGQYPRHDSIKDYGSLLRSPWRRPLVALLGETLTLDQIEHGRLRAYGEPRVHFALNCASLGCPMLREEAYVGERLEAQLEQQVVRFLSDRTRNRAVGGQLLLSPVFRWYSDDFAGGDVARFLAPYAAALGVDRAALASGDVEIEFLDYDWRLNDTRAP